MDARETLIAAVEALEKMGFAILSRSELEAKDKEIAKLLAERDALAAALKAEQEDGWQPIETAPRDGTKVDLWVVDPLGEGRRVPDCSWGWGQWIGPKGLAAERAGQRATHWIHRPTPPQE